MNSIQTLSSILGLSLASGVNLYAAVLVVGLGERYGWIGGLPGELHLLANPIILIVAGVMYILEFFADKIPFVSVAWDTIHTVIRPLGGAALALASAANMSPLAQAVAFLAGGSIALGSHSTNRADPAEGPPARRYQRCRDGDDARIISRFRSAGRSRSQLHRR